MRSSFVALVLFSLCLPLASWADSPLPQVTGHHHHHRHAHHGAPAPCACGHVPAAPVYQSVEVGCSSCSTCDSGCGGSGYGCGCYSGLCNNHAEFYRQLYAEFYARNPWYLEARARESAERRARLIGSTKNAQIPVPGQTILELPKQPMPLP